MSAFLYGTTVGKIIYKNVTYKLLNLPIDQLSLKKINIFKKERDDLAWSTASWLNVSYMFEIIDKQVYLTFIHFNKNKIFENDSANEKLKKYLEDDQSLSSAFLSLKKNKVYKDNYENEMTQVFGTKRQPMNFTGCIKLYSRHRYDHQCASVMWHWLYTIELEVINGVLQDVKNVHWENTTRRVLKNYIPE